jgi:hypothetical protein
VQDKYQWFWLYTAVEPATGESYSLYLPSLDGVCLQVFLEHLKAAYPDPRFNRWSQHSPGVMIIDREVLLRVSSRRGSFGDGR